MGGAGGGAAQGGGAGGGGQGGNEGGGGSGGQGGGVKEGGEELQYELRGLISFTRSTFVHAKEGSGHLVLAFKVPELAGG
eukprot:scaffold28859_cov73-Isochrysis_galbana.AAC.1